MLGISLDVACTTRVVESGGGRRMRPLRHESPRGGVRGGADGASGRSHQALAARRRQHPASAPALWRSCLLRAAPCLMTAMPGASVPKQPSREGASCPSRALPRRGRLGAADRRQLAKTTRQRAASETALVVTTGRIPTSPIDRQRSDGRLRIGFGQRACIPRIRTALIRMAAALRCPWGLAPCLQDHSVTLVVPAESPNHPPAVRTQTSCLRRMLETAIAHPGG